MLKISLGIFLILHGGVHALYLGQSLRKFELTPGMQWPDHSWAFSAVLSTQTLRWFANVSLILSAVGFILGGIALIFSQSWSIMLLLVAGGLSIFLYLTLWDAKRKTLLAQGGLAILLNVFIAIILLRFFQS